MIINIEELKNLSEKQVEVKLNIEQLPDLTLIQPVKGALNLSVEGYGINIEGEFTTEVAVNCDRCLQEFSYPLDIAVDEKLIFGKLVDEQIKEFELTGENFVEDLADKEEIDLTEFIYQEIILNIPSQKLCDFACEGTEEYKKVKIDGLVDPRLEIFKKLSEEN
ncbi:MAG: DUF177 domain-containing protein [bacterium]